MKPFRTVYLFFAICLLYLLHHFLLQEVIITNDIYYSSLGEQLSYQHIDKLLAIQNEWKWLGYATIPVFLFIKFGTVAICLLSGAFLFDIQVDLKSLFRVVVISEFVLLASLTIKLFWFLTIVSDFTLESIQYFQPLSLLSIFDIETLDKWWIYPLQVLNLFEVFYWITLAFLLGKIVESSFDRRLSLVLSSYGTGLLVWIVFITFITLSIS